MNRYCLALVMGLTATALAQQSSQKRTATQSAPATSQPQVLVTGRVASLDEKDHQIKVQSSVVSKALGETSDVQQLTVGNVSSNGYGSVTGAKTLPRKGYVYTINFADAGRVLKGTVAARLADIKEGVTVEVIGTVVKHEPKTMIDSYKVVDGKLVMNTVRVTQTATASTITILTDRNGGK
jgi:hypothetical protein